MSTNSWGTSWGTSWGVSWGGGESPVVIPEEVLAGGGDDDVPKKVTRKRTRKEIEQEYAQLLARVPPDLRPVEKTMRRLGAKPRQTNDAALVSKQDAELDEALFLLMMD